MTVRVKVCGLRSPEDVELCLDTGVDLLGFLVADVDSPRAVGTREAERLIDSVRGAETVAVDTSETADDAIRKLEETGADHLQLHRDDLPLRELKDVAGSCSTIQVLRVGDGLPDTRIVGDYVLLDTRSEDLGGTGETHDWDLSRDFARECPAPVLLAGGLGPDNVAEAVERVEPYGVDAASRLDGEEGKDPERVRRFVEHAKE